MLLLNLVGMLSIWAFVALAFAAFALLALQANLTD